MRLKLTLHRRSGEPVDVVITADSKGVAKKIGELITARGATVTLLGKDDVDFGDVKAVQAKADIGRHRPRRAYLGGSPGRRRHPSRTRLNRHPGPDLRIRDDRGRNRDDPVARVLHRPVPPAGPADEIDAPLVPGDNRPEESPAVVLAPSERLADPIPRVLVVPVSSAAQSPRFRHRRRTKK